MTRFRLFRQYGRNIISLVVPSRRDSGHPLYFQYGFWYSAPSVIYKNNDPWGGGYVWGSTWEGGGRFWLNFTLPTQRGFQIFNQKALARGVLVIHSRLGVLGVVLRCRYFSVGIETCQAPYQRIFCSFCFETTGINTLLMHY